MANSILLTSLLLLICFCHMAIGDDPKPKPSALPNILWITSEDTGPQLGCYGDKFATTPNIDALAARGMAYDRCWSNAPVCAPARTTIITGVFPTSFGGQNMRSRAILPNHIKLLPELVRQQGYYCTNRSKEDYNFIKTNKPWNDSSAKAHWRNRPAGSPFFSVVNFVVSHESQIRARPHVQVHNPAKVPVPPYHPDTPEVRQDWAQYYDKVQEMDVQVGKVLAELKQDGLEEETIVFYYGDHGSGMPRGKRWLYQSGLHVPLIVYVPEKWRHVVGESYSPGSRSNRLISFVDLVPTVLDLVSAKKPAYLQGKSFLGTELVDAPKYCYAFRDRMDERIDMTRAIRDDKYLYIRNFLPYRPQGVYLEYMFQTPTTQVWKRLYDEGKLNAAQSQFWKPKAAEELYDISSDPYQIHNLLSHESTTSDAILQTRQRFEMAMEEWMVAIKDLGCLPEGQVYDLHESGISALEEMRKPENIAAVVHAAMVASSQAKQPSDELARLAESNRSEIRFWAAHGLLNQAAAYVHKRAECVAASNKLSDDQSPYVRVVTAETQARYGDASQRRSAINTLMRLSNTKTHHLFIAMAALNSLTACDPNAMELKDIKDLTGDDARFEKVYQDYVARLLVSFSNVK